MQGVSYRVLAHVIHATHDSSQTCKTASAGYSLSYSSALQHGTVFCDLHVGRPPVVQSQQHPPARSTGACNGPHSAPAVSDGANKGTSAQPEPLHVSNICISAQQSPPSCNGALELHRSHTHTSCPRHPTMPLPDSHAHFANWTLTQEDLSQEELPSHSQTGTLCPDRVVHRRPSLCIAALSAGARLPPFTLLHVPSTHTRVHIHMPRGHACIARVPLTQAPPARSAAAPPRIAASPAHPAAPHRLTRSRRPGGSECDNRTAHRRKAHRHSPEPQHLFHTSLWFSANRTKFQATLGGWTPCWAAGHSGLAVLRRAAASPLPRPPTGPDLTTASHQHKPGGLDGTHLTGSRHRCF